VNRKIVIGSLNQTKINAIATLFPDDEIVSIAAPSNILNQPITNEMTRTGAINRAKFGLEVEQVDYSFGLEGGVTFINEQLYLCNWGALVTTKGEIFTASGGVIPLPTSFTARILAGEELAEIMEDYTHTRDIRSHKGAIGVFTNGLITREGLYNYIGTLLKGQLYYKNR